jgi:hypothetical protein
MSLEILNGRILRAVGGCWGCSRLGWREGQNADSKGEGHNENRAEMNHLEDNAVNQSREELVVSESNVWCKAKKIFDRCSISRMSSCSRSYGSIYTFIFDAISTFRDLVLTRSF